VAVLVAGASVASTSWLGLTVEGGADEAHGVFVMRLSQTSSGSRVCLGFRVRGIITV
jgi:hypothetical protein